MPAAPTAPRCPGETPVISVLALRVRDAAGAYRGVLDREAWAVPMRSEVMELNIPAIYSAGAGRIYFVNRWYECQSTGTISDFGMGNVSLGASLQVRLAAMQAMVFSHAILGTRLGGASAGPRRNPRRDAVKQPACASPACACNAASKGWLGRCAYLTDVAKTMLELCAKAVALHGLQAAQWLG